MEPTAVLHQLAEPATLAVGNKCDAPWHVKALDGLRGIAVLLVMLVHTGAPYSSSGALGVDLFFVLSGFLITTLLLKEKSRNGKISLWKFWGRRFLRLMPVYWLYVGTITLLELFGPYPLQSHGGWHWGWHLASMWMYFVNLLPLGGFSPFNTLTYHLWSLSVEEQFYLIWPVLLVATLRFHSSVTIAWLLVGLVVYQLQTIDSWEQLMLRLDTRGFGIVLGCAAAITAFRYQTTWQVWLKNHAAHSITLSLVLGLACLSFPVLGFHQTDRAVLVFFTPLFSVSTTLLVATLWYAEGGRTASLLSCRPLTLTGSVSYGLYLYNPLAHYLSWTILLPGIEDWYSVPKFALRVGTYIIINYTFAMISYHYFESWFLKLKRYLR
jgi:peptidoglycan/LPS O-acetylase OafA/YrhL